MKKLTQGDLLTYLQSRKHFWAKVNNQYQSRRRFPKKIDQIRPLAKEYIQEILAPNFSQPRIKTKVSVENDRLRTYLDFVITEQDTYNNFLFSVKTGYKISNDHIDELCFKVIAAEEDYPFERIFLLLLNNHYSRSEDLQVKHLFQVVEVTTAVQKQLKTIRQKIDSAFQVAQRSHVLDFDSCTYPENCPCPHLCHPDLPDYSIYDLRGLSAASKRELRDKHIFKITDVPLEYIQSDLTLNQRQLTIDQGTVLNQENIQNTLDKLQFPLYFLDYEAYGFPIPLYEGYWPFSTVVFQYSLHKLHENGELEHFEFMHTDKTDPAPALIDSLKQHIDSEGSIIVWGKRLEEENHRHLARLHPQDMLFLLDLNQRMFDLQDIFSWGDYQDYRFKGSTSLKKVLPVLIPELSHKDLEISDGLTAANEWYSLVFKDMNDTDKTELKNNLLEYCQMDTLALVEIYQYLRNSS